MALNLGINEDDQELFEQLESYRWREDSEFQGGLSAILGSHPSPERSEELTLRARCFFYARKYNTPIDFNRYVAWRRDQQLGSVLDGDALPHLTSTGQIERSLNNGNNATKIDEQSTQASELGRLVSPGTSSSSSSPAVPYPTTFARIVDLISTGEPIPGIKKIPDTVLEGKESHSVASKRRKPWEKSDVGGTAQLA